MPTGTLTNIAPGRGGIERDPSTLGNHRFFAGSQEEMLRRCLKVDVRLARANDALRAEVEVRADDVGHRVPTGFIDHHLLLVLEGIDDQGRPLPALQGPVLPEAAGKGLAGKPGRLYGKLLRDFQGRSPAPFWLADPAFTDSRLHPGQPDRSVYVYAPEVAQVRVRLLYRRFWQEVADVKGWPDNEIPVLEKTLRASGR
jgi:hypothetical protein